MLARVYLPNALPDYRTNRTERPNGVHMAEYVTATEAAGILGCSDALVRKWIRAGKLPATKRGNAWRIDRADLPDRTAGPDDRTEPTEPNAGSVETQLLRAELEAERRMSADLRDRMAAQDAQLATLTTAVTGLTALTAMQRQPRLAAWWSRVRGREIVT